MFSQTSTPALCDDIQIQKQGEKNNSSVNIVSDDTNKLVS